MSLNLLNLDNRTRALMDTELDTDIREDRLYISPRLIDEGEAEYVRLLREATKTHDEEWLADQLRVRRLIRPTEERRRGDRITTVKVPVTAADTLAEGEFNRLYIRGLCLRAIAEGVPHLIVYRAKQVNNPRPESQTRIDTTIDPSQLLKDLRTHQGVDTALGLPAGPNSGLSVKLP